MVIDAGIVLIIMDLGSCVEAHMFSAYSDVNSYSFLKFHTLPDGAKALLLRHDKNKCSVAANFSNAMNITYVTNAKEENNSSNAFVKIDTLYKIGTFVDSVWQIDPGTHRLRAVARISTDTIDMRLYWTIDTIIYKHGGFLNFNARSLPKGVLKVDYYYTVSNDFGTDGEDCIEIKRNGACIM